MCIRDSLKLIRHMLKCLIPGNLTEASVLPADLRQAVGLYGCLLLIQGQSLDAAEAVIDRITAGGHRFHHPVVLYIEIKVAVNGTIITG